MLVGCVLRNPGGRLPQVWLSQQRLQRVGFV